MVLLTLLPEYNVKHCLQIDAYPLVNLTMSPGTNSCPGSSQMETFIQAVLSATLNVRTSRFSLVIVG
ncbi:mRNA export factor [Vespula maculifrons]|uniref:mRNA export factor n=1 Tax=Vespula maculifrons TaxID=7453 RepID=A0ABD2BXG3_VESMC